jgi:F-type H+-transporting ATPase subunit b
MNNPLVQPDPGLYIWTIVTFLVLLWLLAKFAWGPLLDALEQRQDVIKKSLDEARQAKEELQRLQAESARILAEARNEAAGIISTTRSDAARFADEMKQKARADAETVVRNAQREIDTQTLRAIDTIRREAVELSVAVATKILRRDISAADNDKLVDDAIREMQTKARH